LISQRNVVSGSTGVGIGLREENASLKAELAIAYGQQRQVRHA
jgi:hypothetical protein